MAEAGFPELRLEAVLGLFGWRGMDDATRDRLAAETRAILAEPATAEWLRAAGALPHPGTPGDLAALLAEQRTRAAEGVRAFGGARPADAPRRERDGGMRARILAAMFQGGGNVPLILPVLAELVARGQAVRVVAGPGIHRSRLPVSAALLDSLARLGAEVVPFPEPRPHPLDAAPAARGLVGGWAPKPFRGAPGEAQIERLHRRNGLPALNRARAALGLPPLRSAFGQLDRAARVLVLASAAFDFPANHPPANLRHVGAPVEDAAAPQWGPPWPWGTGARSSWSASAPWRRDRWT